MIFIRRVRWAGKSGEGQKNKGNIRGEKEFKTGGGKAGGTLMAAEGGPKASSMARGPP